jgi:hypothetical protein
MARRVMRVPLCQMAGTCKMWREPLNRRFAKWYNKPNVNN